MLVITGIGSEDAFYEVRKSFIGLEIKPSKQPRKQSYGEKGYMTGKFMVYNLWGKDSEISFFAVKYRQIK